MKQKLRMSTEPKRYILRKYIIATDMKQALRLAKDQPIEEVFIDTDWKPPVKESKVGFK